MYLATKMKAMVMAAEEPQQQQQQQQQPAPQQQAKPTPKPQWNKTQFNQTVDLSSRGVHMASKHFEDPGSHQEWKKSSRHKWNKTHFNRTLDLPSEEGHSHVQEQGKRCSQEGALTSEPLHGNDTHHISRSFDDASEDTVVFTKKPQDEVRETQERRVTPKHVWNKGHFSRTFDLSSSAKYLSSKFSPGTASRILKKKLPQSGLLMVPKRLWMQTVPTQDCEVVVLFAPSTGEATVNWLTSCLRLRVPELVISVKSHLAVGCFALYVTATMDGLVRGGEELKVPKKTKPEYGSGLRELSQAELGLFQGIEDPSHFFTSQERQGIVLHLLNSLRAVDGDTIADVTFRPGQAIVPKCQSDGIIKQILPLHDRTKLAQLRVEWVQSFFRYQPLEEIKEYFGAKIGIYFSWLGFYTASLTIPAVIGLVFWINFWGKDQAKEDKAFLVLAFLNVVWGSMWLEAWKRRSAELTYLWGIQDHNHELLEDPRPPYRGNLEISQVTGRLEPVYPNWKRNLFRYLFSVPLIIVCLFIAFIVMFIILKIQEWWDSVIEYRGLPQFFSYGPKFLMAGTISIFDELYSKIAMWLNDMENFRNEESYDNHLIIKMAIFRLVNSFLVLFYIAFYLQDMEILKAQLAALFITRQIVGNIKESCIPYFLEQLKLAKLSFELFGALTPSETAAEKQKLLSDDSNKPKKGEEVEETSDANGITEEEQKNLHDGVSSNDQVPKLPSKSRIVSQAEVESNMSTYNDTVEDYLEMFIQFGYVMLFSSAFPLGAFCAFVNNLIEIRSDAFKLCCVFQRPFGQRARSIGVWQNAMEFMCLLGIMVNCMLIGLSGQVHRMFPEMSTTQTILLIVVLEHAMIALKYGISYAIPDVPHTIAQELAKAEFRRREAFKSLSVSNSPPTNENSEQSSPSKSCPVSTLSSMEYTEKSVQTVQTVHTDMQNTGVSKKPIQEVRTQRDLIHLRRKGSADSRLESEVRPPISVNLGRSVSAGDKVKHCIPKVSKRWNQSMMENSHSLIPDHTIPRGPSPSESLPVLSMAAFDNKSHMFNYPHYEIEKHYPSAYDHHSYSPDDETAESVHSKSSESVVASTIREESVTSDNIDDTETLAEEEPIHQGYEDRRASSPVRVPEGRKSFPSAESLPGSTPPGSSPGDTAEGEDKPEKVGKKHPGKFLKRAQSFSQVFKKMADKRKKYGESIRDDFREAAREPLGELALVPLEKLVSIEDLQKQMISEEP